jgi:hypothetical protein
VATGIHIQRCARLAIQPAPLVATPAAVVAVTTTSTTNLSGELLCSPLGLDIGYRSYCSRPTSPPDIVSSQHYLFLKSAACLNNVSLPHPAACSHITLAFALH